MVAVASAAVATMEASTTTQVVAAQVLPGSRCYYGRQLPHNATLFISFLFLPLHESLVPIQATKMGRDE